jgi:hypothetical protein
LKAVTKGRITIPQECFGNILVDEVLYPLGENLIVDANENLHVFPIPSQATLQFANIITVITLYAKSTCKIFGQSVNGKRWGLTEICRNLH